MLSDKPGVQLYYEKKMYQTGLQTYYCVRGQSALEAYHLYLRLCKSVMGNSAGPRWHDIQHSNFDWRWTIKNLRNRKLLDDGTFHFNINLMNMKADILLLLLKKNMIENFDQHTGWKRIANDTPLLYNGVQPTIDVLKFKMLICIMIECEYGKNNPYI